MVALESSPVIVRETVEWKIKLHRSRLGGVGHRRLELWTAGERLKM